MNEIIQWCNANSGFAMMALTLIYAVAAVIMPGLMVHANRLSSRSIDIAVQLENRLLCSILFQKYRSSAFASGTQG